MLERDKERYTLIKLSNLSSTNNGLTNHQILALSITWKRPNWLGLISDWLLNTLLKLNSLTIVKSMNSKNTTSEMNISLSISITPFRTLSLVCWYMMTSRSCLGMLTLRFIGFPLSYALDGYSESSLSKTQLELHLILSN